MKHIRMRTTINVQGTLPVAVFKEGRKYIAYSPSLDLSAQGTSVADVQKNFDEVFEIYLEETTRHGTLERDLQNHGWRKKTSTWTPPGFASVPANHSEGMEFKAFVIRPFPTAVSA